NNVTLFMVLHGAFALLLSRYGASDDIVIATPVANRLQPTLEPLIGFFVNTLVLRVDCAGQKGLGDYLSQVKTVNLDAQAHQDLPFEHLVEHLNPTRSTAHSPIFQIMFSMMASDTTGEVAQGDFTVKPMKGDKTIAKFELSLNAQQSTNGLLFNLTYNTDLFEQKTIKRLSNHLTDLLVAMVDSPTAKVHTLALNQQIECLPLKPVAMQRIDELIAAQPPESCALVFESQTMTYGQLNRRANQLANYLQQQGVGKDTLAGGMVGVCIPRSIEMIVTMVAILKAGGAYVPLDPEYPTARLDYMIKDSGVSLVIYSGGVDCGSLSDTCPAVVFDPKAAAYVIYTSGSTGKPKGVVVEHGALNNFSDVFDQQLNDLSVRHLNAWLLTASIAFDASLKALIALSKGATVVVASSDESRDPAALAELVKL
ncbi:MAG: AMP-binding protein, partial [Psychrosphaera sp.]|nr:AMP-binding protein [Psychrosphaera sp.]